MTEPTIPASSSHSNPYLLEVTRTDEGACLTVRSVVHGTTGEPATVRERVRLDQDGVSALAHALPAPDGYHYCLTADDPGDEDEGLSRAEHAR